MAAGSSKLRVMSAAPGKRAPDYADSLYMIRDSVRRRDRLIYGKLHDGQGASCAIGGFFEDNPNLALNSDIIDEVAAYNDSIPKHYSERTRQREVLKWLNWKLRMLAGDIKAVVKPGLRLLNGGKKAS